MALIYKKPAGPRIDSFSGEETPLRNSFERFKSVLLSIVSACESLKGYHLTHRAIRLDNIYYKDSSRNEVVIGDCAVLSLRCFNPRLTKRYKTRFASRRDAATAKLPTTFTPPALLCSACCCKKNLRQNFPLPKSYGKNSKKELPESFGQ